MSGSRRSLRNRKKKDEDFVPKTPVKRDLQEAASAPARKLTRLYEHSIDDSYDKNVAHLFSLSNEELEEASQVTARLTHSTLFNHAPDPRTPLQRAAATGSLAEVNLIVAAGTFVDDISGCGQTALFLATEAGHVNVVRALLAAHADPAIVNFRHGKRVGSPLDLVECIKLTPNHEEIFSLFIEHQLPKFEAFKNKIMP